MTKTQKFSHWNLVIDYYLESRIWILEFNLYEHLPLS
jgi:hypothetical protein